MLLGGNDERSKKDYIVEMKRVLSFATALLLLSSLQLSYGQSLVTDRPDFTESAIVVPRGTVQIESGVTVSAVGSETATSAPELLVRWGLAGRAELRVQSPDFTIADGSSGVGDPSVGFKYEFAPVRDWSVAAIAVTSIPVGDDTIGSMQFEPLVIVAVGTDVGVVSVGSQVEGAWDGDSESVLFGGTFVLGTALGSGVGAFVESALSQEPSGTAALTLHSGLTYAAAHLVQIDLHFGAGLTETAPDVFVGVGLSLRR